jgi:hypothetical protein
MGLNNLKKEKRPRIQTKTWQSTDVVRAGLNGGPLFIVFQSKEEYYGKIIHKNRRSYCGGAYRVDGMF